MVQEMTSEPKRLSVGFHYGNVIKYLAETYGTGFEVVREAVQNAIDKTARNIFVKIDCITHLVSVFDDGDGASEAELQEKFDLIGLSLKLGQPGMVGQKGIGNLAAFAIGRVWQLFTRDVKVGGELRGYTFDRAELTKAENVGLQSERVPFKKVTGASFPATTMLRIVDVDEGVLRQLGDKNTIERTLREAFNVKLRSNKINLRVSYRSFKNQTTDFMVKPTRFRGTPLDAVEYETKHGAVTFEFYHSHEPLKDPSILVLHQGVYSIPLLNFIKLRILPLELEPLFAKGYFEGEIRLDFCKLNSSRSAFEHDVEQKSFVGAVEGFATEILKPLTEQFEQSDRQERLKKIAETVLKKMKQFLNRYPNLLPQNLKTEILKWQEDPPEKKKKEGVVTSPTERKAKPPLPPDALKKQRKETQVIKRGGVKPKKPVVELRDGLAIQIVNPEAEEGFTWHSRLVNGII